MLFAPIAEIIPVRLIGVDRIVGPRRVNALPRFIGQLIIIGDDVGPANVEMLQFFFQSRSPPLHEISRFMITLS